MQRNTRERGPAGREEKRYYTGVVREAVENIRIGTESKRGVPK
jgi:hypothetical protein